MPTNDQPRWRAHASNAAPDGDGLLIFCSECSRRELGDDRRRHERYGGGVLAEVAAAALICLDPGHGTAPEIGRQLEPIGPGSTQLKIKDPGGAAGEAPVALAIARRTRAAPGAWLPRRHDPRRHRLPRRQPRARPVLQRAGRGLMLRIHADGSSDPRARRRDARAGVAARLDGRRARRERPCRSAPARGSSPQPEHATSAWSSAPTSTGFNWADVPVVLVETGSSRTDGGDAVAVGLYQQRLAGALARAAQRFVAR